MGKKLIVASANRLIDLPQFASVIVKITEKIKPPKDIPPKKTVLISNDVPGINRMLAKHTNDKANNTNCNKSKQASL